MVMSAKMKLFCEEFVVDTNATQAAIRAGYAKKSAKVTAHKLLKKEEIKRYINSLMEERQKTTIAKAEEVLEFLTSVMRGEEQNFFNISTTIEDGLETEFSKQGKFTPKIEDRLSAACELLKRYPLILDDELQKAKIKKAIAEAEIAESKARIMSESGNKVADKMDEFLEKLVDEVEQNESQ